MITHAPDNTMNNHLMSFLYEKEMTKNKLTKHKLMDINEIDTLIVSYLTDEIGEDESTLLKNWVNESESNRSHFDQKKELWISVMSKEEKKTYDPQRGYERFRKRVYSTQKRKTRRNHRFYYALACCIASVAVLFVGKALYSHRDAKNPQYFYVQAPLASTASFTLPDGSSICLNAGSRLTYDSKFGKKERLVHLEGEAYFDVHHDERKTFIVKTDRLTITDIGTSFNIKDYPDDDKAQIALVQGKISLCTTSNDIEMVPGEIASVDKTSGKTTMKKGGIESAISWISGCYLFEDEPLESITKKLERGFNVTIVVKNEDALKLKFNGYFENGSDNIDDILYTLSQTGKIKCSKQNGVYYIF